MLVSEVTVAGTVRVSVNEHVNTAKGAENEVVEIVTDVAPSEGPCEGVMARIAGALKNTKDTPPTVKSAPLLDNCTMTVPSAAAGVTQMANAEEMTVARVKLCPNLQSIPDKKFTPMTVIEDPPVLAPMLGISADATSAATYSKEVETERSTPLFKTSKFTTAGDKAIGEMQTITFSETKVTEPEKVEPNLQRTAL
jgi:hypothetical protein